MDGFCLKAGIHGMSPPIAVVGAGSLDIRSCVSGAASVGRDPSSVSVEKWSAPSWGFSFRHPLRLLRLGNGGTMHEATLASDNTVSVEDGKEYVKEDMIEEDNVVQDENWVFKILHIRSIWKKEGSGEKRLEEVEDISNDVGQSSSECCSKGKEECEGCSVDGDGEKVVFDRNSFSNLLRRVPLAEARSYAKLSYLGNLAYSIPRIKPANLLRSHGLRFVTSSLERKEHAQTEDSGKTFPEDAGEDNEAVTEEACKDIEEAKSAVDNQTKETLHVDDEQLQGHRIGASAAYQIAASAASYLNHHTKSVLPLIFSKSKQNEEASDGNCAGNECASTVNEEVASLKATTDSVTAVVSAKEEVKQAVADDLNSTKSSPCEWYACDDEQSGTRFFVIQGSESLASWQANLLFEPVPFEVGTPRHFGFPVKDHVQLGKDLNLFDFDSAAEVSGSKFYYLKNEAVMLELGLVRKNRSYILTSKALMGFDVLVHRGIYEAAKGIYQQMLPEVRKHLQYNGNRATLRFTGHSLGGSLSLLINLMLLIRGEVPSSSLLPVITFGAPTVMCGGNQLLQKLGLPQSHVKAIAMHRDIVPRAFSCHYPNHVAEFLKVVNGSFRTLPCLSKKNLLYAPMGDLLILQPEDKFSPSHDLLPSGSGLYLLSCDADDLRDGARQIEAARAVFLNSPHPLEILSDRGAYGAAGHIQRDHDMGSYLKSVQNVVRQELSRMRKAKRQVCRRVWWPLVASGGTNPGIAPESYVASAKMMQEQLNLSCMLQSGKESLKRFGRVVTSQHMYLLALLPARLLILGTSRII